MDVTRWRADTTKDNYGSFLYLRDLDSGQIWSNLYHPLNNEPERYSVTFPLDRAEYRRRDNGIETKSEIIISPEDNIEIRRITLTNRSIRSRRIQAAVTMNLLWPHITQIVSIQHSTSCSFRQKRSRPAMRCWLTGARGRRMKHLSILFTVWTLLQNLISRDYLNMKQIDGCLLAAAAHFKIPWQLSQSWVIQRGLSLIPVFSIRRDIHLPRDKVLSLSLSLVLLEAARKPWI